jgi:hypothetical protein
LYLFVWYSLYLNRKHNIYIIYTFTYFRHPTYIQANNGNTGSNFK